MKKGTGAVPKFFSKLNFNSLVNVSIGSLIIIQIFFITGSTTNFMNLVDSSFQKTITITLSVVSLLITFKSMMVSFILHVLSLLLQEQLRKMDYLAKSNAWYMI